MEGEDVRVDGDVSSSPFGGTETHQGSETPNGMEHLQLLVPAQKSSMEEISETGITQLFSTTTSEASSEDHCTNGGNAYTNNADESRVVEERMPEADDVEKVINTQETHDLFCPNCNSCITKRVILRPRKRKIQEISPAPSEDDINPDIFIPGPLIEETDQGAFECLTCFSIFIPIARSFNLKRIFGDEQDAQLTTSPDVPQHGNETGVVVDIGQEQITVISQPSLLPYGFRQNLPKKAGGELPDECDNIRAETEIEEKEVHVVIYDSKAPDLPSTSVPQKEITGDEDVETAQKEPDHTVVRVTLTNNTSTETEPLLQPDSNDELAAVVVALPDSVDFIKSMVYGGLLESIASLSVVTSAAAADAKTLNIVALGAANMFGGLFLLAHNLRVLKHENSKERYEEVLGHQGHFTFHSVFAVLSYLVFGLIPPLAYGFTFHESDNRSYKVMVVASISLVCIVLLAFGKAHTRTRSKDYTKTLIYYVSLWVMACGVSYLAGQLLYFLLKKLNLFDFTTSTSIGFITPWASYPV